MRLTNLLTNLLLAVSLGFATQYLQEIERWKNRMQNFTPQQAEQELRQKAGFKTQENDLGSLLDRQKQQEMIDLFQKFKSRAVREFTCYQVRTIKVNAKIEEDIETNCPTDPTFGGQCQQISSKVLEPQECREINGMRFCRDWWKKEFVYRCDGNVSIDQLLSTFEGFEYCTYERRCVRWEDVQKRGGTVSCRIYYDKNKPGCDSNPYQPQCIANDCGELFDRCTLLNYTDYSDIPDKANLEYKQYCDPVSGICGYMPAPGTSGVALGIYTFSCPSNLRKICRQWEITKVCPDGTETVCNTVSVCKKYKTQNARGYEPGSCLIERPYKSITVIKDSPESNALKNNPLCIKVGETTETKNTVGIFSWGWDGDFGDDCSSCESYVTGLVIKSPEGDWFKGTGTCYYVNGAPGIFPKEWQLKNFYNHYLQNVLKLPASVVSVNLSARRRVGVNPYDRACFGDDDGNRDYEVPLRVTFVYETYKCFADKLDMNAVASSCNISENCEPLSPINNLEELECYAFEQDSENPTRMVCSKYSVMYRCPSEKRSTECVEWETRTVCSDGTISIPSLTLEGKNFSKDFAQAIGLAQAVNELKHVWTGEPKVCESGWWNSIIENPGEYFLQKAVGFAVSKLGGALATGARAFFKSAEICIFSDSIANIEACMYEVAKAQYNSGNEATKSFLDKICGGNGGELCSIAEFLSDPVISFAVGVIVDIILSTEKCSTCSSEKCAARHSDYQEYVLISKGLCHYIGSKCSWKIDLGFTEICLRRAYKYCCFDSRFARILVGQAYKQLGYSWGGYDNPNCSALTFEDLKKLDFSAMDFSELIAEIEAKMQMKIDDSYIKQVVEDFFSSDIQPTGETPWGSGQ